MQGVARCRERGGVSGTVDVSVKWSFLSLGMMDSPESSRTWRRANESVSAEAGKALEEITGSSRFEASGEKSTVAQAAGSLSEAFDWPEKTDSDASLARPGGRMPQRAEPVEGFVPLSDQGRAGT